MRFLSAIACTAALAWLLGLWLPFWSLSLAGVFAGFMLRPGGWKALLAGVLAGALLWGGLAFVADAANGHILATRIGALFGMGAEGMVALTAALGALLAGLGTLFGDRVRKGVA